MSLRWIRDLNRFAPKPDLVILLDVSPETGLGRMRRNRRTVFEVLSNQHRVRALYLQFADLGEMVRVDAKRSVEEVQGDIVIIIQDFLEGRNMNI